MGTLGSRLRFYRIAEPAKEAQRRLDEMVFALPLLSSVFRLLGAAPEHSAIPCVQDEEPYLRNVRRRKAPAGRGGASGLSATRGAAHADARIRDGSVNGGNKVGLPRVS